MGGEKEGMGTKRKKEEREGKRRRFIAQHVQTNKLTDRQTDRQTDVCVRTHMHTHTHIRFYCFKHTHTYIHIRYTRVQTLIYRQTNKQ